MSTISTNSSFDGNLVKTGLRRWLLLPVEAKCREFDAKVFLACMAAERGYSVLIGHYDVINRWISCLPRGMLLEKNISVRYKSRLHKLRSQGYRLCVNDEESLGLFLNRDIWLRIRMNHEMVALVDHVFAWSEANADVIRDAYPDQANKVLGVGTPRVDLLRRELRGLFDQEVSQLRKRFGKYILLPSNFAEVINVRGDDYTKEKMWRHGYIKNKEEEQGFIEHIKHERANLDAFVAVLKRIREEFPQHALVVRPHPIDRHEFWHEAIRGIDNAHVVYEGSVTPWLLAADAIFHWGCSTGMEARLLECCSVAYHPHYDERMDNLPSTDIGPIVHNEDDLISFIRSAIANQGACELDNRDVAKYICSLDGVFASEKVVNAFDQVTFNDDVLDLTLSNPKALKVRLHEWVRAKRRALRSRKIDNKKRSAQKWPGATKEEVQDLVKKYDELTGQFADLDIRQVVGDLFCISKQRQD